MANCANSTSTPIASRRRLGASLLAVMAGTVLTSGIAAGVGTSVGDLIPADTDAELIAACAHFNELERLSRARLYAAKTAEEEKQADQFRTHLFGAEDRRDWSTLTRVCTTPASSLAAAVALAKTISFFDEGDMIAPEDDPDGYVTERLLAALMRCLLGSAAA